MRSFALIVACKWLPSPSARYAVVRAGTCQCARSARDVRDPTVQTRSQYRSKRFRKPGGDINDAEDSIREGQCPLRANPRLIMCRVCRDPFLTQPRPFAPESRISYLESCAYGTRGFKNDPAPLLQGI